MRSFSLVLVSALAVFAGLSFTKPISSPVEKVTAEKTSQSTEPGAQESEPQNLNEMNKAVASSKEPPGVGSRSSREQKHSNDLQEVIVK